jgi:hypothetical protein
MLVVRMRRNTVHWRGLGRTIVDDSKHDRENKKRGRENGYGFIGQVCDDLDAAV